MCALKFKEIDPIVQLLFATLKLKQDYRYATGKSNYVLIVEGNTDKYFSTKVLKDDVNCISVRDFLNTQNAFSTSPLQNPINHKNVIESVVTGICTFPGFLSSKEEIEKWHVYGLIDSDYQSISNARVKNLFVIEETHDLETLLLSTDKNLLSKIDRCEITIEQQKMALYLAYQMSFARKIIGTSLSYKSLDIINDGNNICGYTDFVLNGKINIFNMADYLVKKGSTVESDTNLNRLHSTMSKDKLMRKHFDSNGLFIGDKEHFLPEQLNDFWKIINGHDVLQFVALLNENVYSLFFAKKNHSIQRDFEMNIIDKYDYGAFVDTELYKYEKEADLLRQI